MKMRDQIAGVETAGKVSMESQSVKKCLKVVVFVCRVIPSVYTQKTTNNLEVRQGRLKMRDMKMRDQIAGVETAGKVNLSNPLISVLSFPLVP